MSHLRNRPLRRWLRCRWPRDERGSSAVEMLIMITSAVALVIAVVATGNYVKGSGQANDAAYAAARAASLQPDQAGGLAAGRAAADHWLGNRGTSCQDLTVSFGGSSFKPGGQVIARVSCTVNLIGTGWLGRRLGLRPAKVFTDRAVVPIESFRSEQGTQP